MSSHLSDGAALAAQGAKAILTAISWQTEHLTELSSQFKDDNKQVDVAEVDVHARSCADDDL
jgi:NADP-dependent 3-hydroxy acid dehydrogenase YdfG